MELPLTFLSFGCLHLRVLVHAGFGFLYIYGDLRDLFVGVDKTRNMEHPGTFRNIPEHPGTSNNYDNNEKNA